MTWDRTSMRERYRLVLAAAVLGLIGFVLFWFQPQKLWIDESTVEESPVRPAGRGATNSVSGPTVVAAGEFVSRDHHTSGTVRIVALEDGRRIARIEGLDTSNGPDLFVYVSRNPASGPEQAFDDDFVSLGRLKGNQGDQNYDVPLTADLNRLSTVVIWCDRFDSVFGAADLLPAS